MILALILILVITFGGVCLTYAFAKDEPALWRFAVGTVIGSAIFGTVNSRLGNTATCSSSNAGVVVKARP